MHDTHGTHDEWLGMLSEYIDGELPSDAAQALEAHLAACDACSRTLAELRTVIAAAASLEDAPPARDLWAGIAAGIGAARPDVDTDVLPLRPSRRERRRGYSFTLPQMAAAAMLLMAFSAGGAWFITRQQSAPETAVGTIVHTAATPAGDARLAASGEDPEATVRPPVTAADLAELERAAETLRNRLDPATADIMDQSLASIDDAIATARTALEADPGNPHLSRQLDNTMRKKLDILRRAYRVQRAGT